MRFSIEIPDRSNLRVSHPIFKVIPAGTLIHRVHHNDYDPDQFNPTHRGNARFSPVRTSDDDIIPMIYAGETFLCAVSEIVLRNAGCVSDRSQHRQADQACDLSQEVWRILPLVR